MGIEFALPGQFSWKPAFAGLKWPLAFTLSRAILAGIPCWLALNGVCFVAYHGLGLQRLSRVPNHGARDEI